MNLAFVDKLANQNNKVKYLLVAVDVFSRFVRVQTMKTKYAKDTLQAKIISKKTLLKSFGLMKEQNMGELSKNFARKKGKILSKVLATKVTILDDHASPKTQNLSSKMRNMIGGVVTPISSCKYSSLCKKKKFA